METGYTFMQSLFKEIGILFQYVVFTNKSCEMWWLNGSAPDLWGRCLGFLSGISHNDTGALQDHCVLCNNVEKLRKRGKPTPEAKKN